MKAHLRQDCEGISQCRDCFGCYKLGMMYDIGEGFDADPKKALELYRSGCSYLDGRSCGMIGHRYLKGGGGVMKSSQEAVRHFELGCVTLAPG